MQKSPSITHFFVYSLNEMQYTQFTYLYPQYPRFSGEIEHPPIIVSPQLPVEATLQKLRSWIN